MERCSQSEMSHEDEAAQRIVGTKPKLASRERLHCKVHVGNGSHVIVIFPIWIECCQHIAFIRTCTQITFHYYVNKSVHLPEQSWASIYCAFAHLAYVIASGHMTNPKYLILIHFSHCWCDLSSDSFVNNWRNSEIVSLKRRKEKLTKEWYMASNLIIVSNIWSQFRL